MKANQTIVLYMNDGVECGRTQSILDAYKLLQTLKVQDKEYNYKGVNYYFELEEETEDAVYYTEVAIYKRGNKVYLKAIEDLV